MRFVFIFTDVSSNVIDTIFEKKLDQAGFVTKYPLVI